MTEQEQQYVRQLEQAVLEAECVMADWKCARRKGYIRDAQLVVFAAADHIRRVRREGYGSMASSQTKPSVIRRITSQGPRPC